MSYKSVNEIEQFNFDDCQVTEFESTGNEIRLVLEALIVKARNSQNTNFTESYAGTTSVKLENGCIISAVKDGLKYYNADGVLQNEIPDKELSKAEIKSLIKKCPGAYLYSMEKQKQENDIFYYEIGIEFVDEEDNTMGDSYRIRVSFDRAVFMWEHFMNRVQS